MTKGCESRESTGKVPRTKLELPPEFPPTSTYAGTATLTTTTTATTISITTPCVHRDFLQLFMELRHICTILMNCQTIRSIEHALSASLLIAIPCIFIYSTQQSAEDQRKWYKEHCTQASGHSISR